MDKINERQKQVLEALEDIAPATNREVAERSMIPINVVTPRMGELVKKGMVVKAYINIDINGRKAIYWEPNSMRWNDEVADIA
jgi:DNA-binding Lrp family transcriptional regulator